MNGLEGLILPPIIERCLGIARTKQSIRGHTLFVGYIKPTINALCVPSTLGLGDRLFPW